MKKFLLLNIDGLQKIIEIDESNYKQSICYLKDFIIKESNNLLDLLEIGDLVELVTTQPEIESFKREFLGLTELKAWIKLEGCKLYKRDDFEEEILKIYKPNKNKGYDLVWSK